jgi:hypothetical protein
MVGHHKIEHMITVRIPEILKATIAKNPKPPFFVGACAGIENMVATVLHGTKMKPNKVRSLTALVIQRFLHTRHASQTHKRFVEHLCMIAYDVEASLDLAEVFGAACPLLP